MSQPSLKHIAMAILALVVVPIFIGVRHFEEAGKFDSIGLWYTMCVTVFFSTIVVAAVVLLVALVQWLARAAQINR